MQTMPDYRLDALFRSALETDAEALAPAAATESEMLNRVREALTRRRGRRQLMTLLIAGALLTLTAGAIALATDRLRPPVTPDATPGPTPQATWTGPLRTDADGEVIALSEYTGAHAWRDAEDAASSWADLTNVGRGNNGQTAWKLEFAAPPPQWSGIDPTETVIAYGLVFETTGDGIADYVVGIDNNAPRLGQFRVWVTNVATGESTEQLGPPYGYPVEFVHPDEHPEDPFMQFWFLQGSSPPGAAGAEARFYTWASVTQGDEVIAWDYAPDAAWLGREPTEPAVSEGPQPSASALPSASPREVVHRWPDTTENQPGLYAWGHSGCLGGCNGYMHNGYGSGNVAIVINRVAEGAVPDDGASVVTVAGHDGIYTRIDALQEEWFVEIDGTTIRIRLTAQPGTSDADLDEAHAIIDSMYTEATEAAAYGFRLIFRLTTDDWDSG